MASKGWEYVSKMRVEIEELKKEAIEWVRKSNTLKMVGDNKCQTILTYLNS
jgi:hypothetical protein